MTAILDGIVVVDLSVARAGPTTVKLLAEWGASVVRVEMAGGDPGVVLDQSSSDYINLHANKRSITLDLKQDEGRDALLALIDRADILIENFRPGVTERLGIAYHQLEPDHQELIYGSISGYGQDGPRARAGAVDQVIQGLSGLMSITGAPGGVPTRTGIAIADLAAGTMLANGVLLALLERARSGRGQWVRTSLLESLLSFLDFQAVRWVADGEVPQPAGNDHPTLTPMGTFQASDGYLNIAAPSERLWERFCSVLGDPTLLDHPDYRDAAGRRAHKAALVDRLQAIIVTRTRAEWTTRLDEVGVPCGPVNSVAEAFADPQVGHLGIVEAIDHPVRGRLGILRTPLSMSRSTPVGKRSSPTSGEHTDEILTELGYDGDAIDSLRSKGIV